MKYRSLCLLSMLALALVVLAGAPLVAGASGLADSEPAAPAAAAPAAALTGVKAFATGGAHTCVINQSDGSVSCWGSNSSGQIGDGSTGSRDLPVKVTALGTGVVDIAAGAAHTCAVTSGGAVKCWGDASEGQLGDNQRGTNRLSPVQVSGLTSGATAVAAGSLHTCALLSDGTVKCWGANDKSQLGDNSTTRRLVPQQVLGISGATAIAAGAKHTCAVVSGGALKCWGANLSGQVGNGTFSDFSSKTPQDVIGLASGVTDVAAGDQHTCAVAAGGVKCWGENGQGQLGIDSTADQNEPQTVPGLAATRVTAGGASSCAVLAGGTVSCWGRNQEGQLGDGTGADSLKPVAVASLAGVSDVAAGGTFACALSGGALSCWGDNATGQLADGSMIFRAVRSDIAGLGPVKQLTAGYSHTCAIKANDDVMCWGNNFGGQLGDGTKVQRSTPVAVPQMKGSSQLAAGGAHTCALAGGSVSCWGRNQEGQLGDGTVTDRPTPGPTNPPLIGVTSVASGLGHSCAILGGGVKCWGNGTKGQIGDGAGQTRYQPVNVSGVSNATMLALGAEHTCALGSDGSVKCWGSNDNGQLGDGTQTGSLVPVSVLGLPTAKAITAGGAHTCALLNDDTVRCWGLNDKGQLGNETYASSTTPVAVSGLPPVSKIAAGGPHTSAVSSTGATLYCWGSGGLGELGNWGLKNQNKPVAIQGASAGTTALALGQSHTCAELSDQATACWGWDGSGQLGQGTTTRRLAPVASQAFMPATVTVDPANGKPGSQFLVTGFRFTPGQPITFTLNDVAAGLTLATDSTDSGSFVVVLDTTGNAAGRYLVRAAQPAPGVAASAGVSLSDSLPVRQVAGGSLTISAPGAQPIVLKYLFLPIIRK